jgi:uncharacterized protein YjbJ (UPF0337 family)
MVRRVWGTDWVHESPEKVNDMGAGDKASNAAQDLAGKAKEAAGEARGDRPQKNEGKREQQKADLKKAAEHVKDAGKK